MTVDERLRSELLATFRIELAEHCQALTRAFLALEKEPDAGEQGRLLDAAFRSAHNLKGAARAVALGGIEKLAHRVEGVLGSVRREEVELSPTLFDLLYAAVDTLSSVASDEAPDDHLQALMASLDAAQTGSLLQFAQPSAPPLPLAESARSAGEGGDTIRVPAARLDALLDQLGELVVPRLELHDSLAELAVLRTEAEAWQRQWRELRPHLRQLEQAGVLSGLRPVARFLERNESNLSALAPRLNALQERLSAPTAQLRALTDDLQRDVKRFRMLPFGILGGSCERAVRDLARSLGKEARLVLIGSDTEMDRRALEEMKDPLLHLLRNAMDHGIESPAERQRLNKPMIGSVVLAAAQRGDTIVIEVEDDGAGIRVGDVRHTAAESGLRTSAELAAMPDPEVLKLIFLPGFSTRQRVTEVSGRGVGLDVVARNVERLGGRVDVEPNAAGGTRFSVTIPLTLATARALLVESGEAMYALPIASIERVLRAERLGSMAGRPMLEFDGGAVPVVSLSSLLGTAARSGPTPERNGKEPAPTLALVGSGTHRLALMIDRVIGEQEIVVKPLPFPVLRVRHVAGATILGSGRIVPILNIADLLRDALRIVPPPVGPAPAEVARRRLRVLIADDSLTTRTLERYILEAAGYEVEVAADGAEALAVLNERGCDVLVSDVEMPGLDGVELTARVRAEPGLRDLTVILVTSLDSVADRERGLQAGADAYIVKSSFDQDQLLRTIREFAA